MITKRISGQQKQPGSFILQAEPLSRSYHVAESICRIYNKCKHISKSGIENLSGPLSVSFEKNKLMIKKLNDFCPKV